MFFTLALIAIVTGIVTVQFWSPQKRSETVSRLLKQIQFLTNYVPKSNPESDPEDDPEAISAHDECLEVLKSKTLPDHVNKGIQEKLICLKHLKPKTDTVTRQFFWSLKKRLEIVCAMPWGIYTKDNLDVEDVSKRLDSSIFGVEKLKDRVLEYVTISNLKKETKGFSVWLIASVGAGKETWAKAVAHALNRSFITISMKDITGEKIKGTRSRKGMLSDALIKCKSMNPVIYLKEFQQMKNDDSATVQFEKIISEAHLPYLDEYLDVELDISKVIFIIGSNVTPLQSKLDGIWGSAINIRNPTDKTRQQLITACLLPESIKEVGLESDQITMTPAAVQFLTDNIFSCYTTLSNVKTTIDVICRHAVRKVNTEQKTIVINETTVKELFWEKQIIYGFEHIPVTQPGVVSYVTGAAFRVVEASIVKPKRDLGVLSVSGQVGVSMRETINTARAVANVILKNTELENTINDHNMHLNFPCQSHKKDDSDSGLGVLMALLSLVTKTVIPKGTTFIGELVLSQAILGEASFSSMRSKAMVCQKRKCKRLFMAEQSRTLWDSVSTDITANIEAVYVNNVSDIICELFGSSELSKRDDMLHMYN